MNNRKNIIMNNSKQINTTIRSKTKLELLNIDIDIVGFGIGKENITTKQINNNNIR